MSQLIKYELTEEGKKYLPKEGGNPKGQRISLPSNRLGDPHFEVYGGLLRDYHCENLLKRKDEKGKRFVRIKPEPKVSENKSKK